jgi:cytochrome c oxidase subunit 2
MRSRAPSPTRARARPHARREPRTLGAGVDPNTAEHRAAWVGNAQAIKPGTNMPPQPLPAADFDALLAYLGSLQ